MIPIYMPQWVWSCYCIRSPLDVTSFYRPEGTSTWIYSTTGMSNPFSSNKYIMLSQSSPNWIRPNQSVCPYYLFHQLIKFIIANSCILPQTQAILSIINIYRYSDWAELNFLGLLDLNLTKKSDKIKLRPIWSIKFRYKWC